MILLFVVVVVYSLTVPRHLRYLSDSGDAKIFSQVLDHFNALDTLTFPQRYWENTTFLTSDGPMLMYIVGKHHVPKFVSEVYAKALGAGAVALEHRYYGESIRSKDVEVDDLTYLSSRQALEDLANFRSYYDASVGGGRKWIIIGGSYSGALSAWARLKYPNLWDGALASSGVVNALYDFYEFDEQASESVGTSCASVLRNGTSTIESLVLDPSSKDKTMEQFGGTTMAVGDFMWMMADLTAVPPQYGFQKHLCDTVLKYASDPLAAMIHAYNDVFAHYGMGSPKEYDSKYLLVNDNNFIRMWWWQKCSELAYFQVAPAKNSIRSKLVNLSWHNERCKTAYGIQNVETLVDKSQWHYGATKVLKETTNIFFTNGSQDPWKRATVRGTEKMNAANVYYEVTCETCGHCCDMSGCPDQSCVKELAIVQNQILSQMKLWI